MKLRLILEFEITQLAFELRCIWYNEIHDPMMGRGTHFVLSEICKFIIGNASTLSYHEDSFSRIGACLNKRFPSSCCSENLKYLVLSLIFEYRK